MTLMMNDCWRSWTKHRNNNNNGFCWVSYDHNWWDTLTNNRWFMMMSNSTTKGRQVEMVGTHLQLQTSHAYAWGQSDLNIEVYMWECRDTSKTGLQVRQECRECPGNANKRWHYMDVPATYVHLRHIFYTSVRHLVHTSITHTCTSTYTLRCTSVTRNCEELWVTQLPPNHNSGTWKVVSTPSTVRLWGNCVATPALFTLSHGDPLAAWLGSMLAQGGQVECSRGTAKETKAQVTPSRIVGHA